MVDGKSEQDEILGVQVEREVIGAVEVAASILRHKHDLSHWMWIMEVVVREKVGVDKAYYDDDQSNETGVSMAGAVDRNSQDDGSLRWVVVGVVVGVVVIELRRD